MTKKYLATMALAVLSLGASAQSQPNRLLVNEKSGAIKSFRLASVDSLSFYTIEGAVRADLTFNNFTSGNSGDTIWVAAKKSDNCVSYRIDVLPSARVKAYSDNDIARYFDINQGSLISDDFTNASLTGFETTIFPNSKYTVFTLGYDKLSTPCEVSRVEFTSPKADIKGNPVVECTYTATQKEITFSMKPNSDVLSYYITIFEKGQAEANFEKWAPMFGFANMGQMIQQFCGSFYSGNKSTTISGLTPGTDYELYIQPMDRNNNYADIIVVPCATEKMGGSGKALVGITVKDDFASVGNGNYTQTVVYTPNAETSLHRDMIIEKKAFNDANGEWKGNDNALIEYLQKPNENDPYWDQYGVDEAVWYVNPSTTYIAASIGMNANGEWGTLTKKEFTTPSATKAPAKASTVGKRAASTTMPIFNGKVLSKTKFGVRLSE